VYNKYDVKYLKIWNGKVNAASDFNETLEKNEL